ncbi:hypothetical protein CBS101457_001486 [Exobasidium rhododendri]|nr:hypothetical protein CBS101457_001486 [Exobasidium rhododendri]
MQFFSHVLTALVVASSASASLSRPGSHPAGHLFVRGAHERGRPAKLYQGIDPQLQDIGPREPVVHDSTVKRHCQHDITHFAPRHLIDEHGSLLQKRQSSTTSPGTGTAYPAAGSDPPAANTLPQAWVDKYNQVKAAGLIPDIGIATENAAGTVSYPSGTDMTKVCSWTIQKCNDGNIFNAPDNTVAFGIDDGPTPDGTPDYLDVLSSNNISATHFLIGSAIYWNMPTMQQLIDASPSQHLAVHTWSHTLQTTKTDLEIVGDLGWVMQIIYDLSGKIPMFFRPPEGDVDNRVKAIAKYVLGLQTVLWTHDADDWCLREGTGTATSIASCVASAPNLATVRKAQQSWASPKTNNTGWITLNHETTDQAAKAFAAMIKAAKKENWDIVGTIPDLQALPWYNNAYASSDTPAKQRNILPTKNFVNVTNPTAAKGSADAPKLGDWAKSDATSSTSSSSAGTQASKGSNSTNTSLSGNRTTTSSASALSVTSCVTVLSVLSTVYALVV